MLTALERRDVRRSLSLIFFIWWLFSLLGFWDTQLSEKMPWETLNAYFFICWLFSLWGVFHFITGNSQHDLPVQIHLGHPWMHGYSEIAIAYFLYLLVIFTLGHLWHSIAWKSALRDAQRLFLYLTLIFTLAWFELKTAVIPTVSPNDSNDIDRFGESVELNQPLLTLQPIPMTRWVSQVMHRTVLYEHPSQGDQQSHEAYQEAMDALLPWA